ncbi:MAG: hypothetical protein A2566_01180 [Candidatus Zambryskibacteria bacterium RIFOXYD1_FULL_40_13]|nr:MAG: hypothetical protein UU06_C0008G0004 [Parcubacteria group bacterium GW2011_GWB1_40_5]KKR80882.1 MAG: hypothetical protein UU27_C0020G0008 [Parcubacteria group bacterium GW2011_GWD1_40_9]OHB16153.1 MAG: hypothetical protein A2566_01180 [Candidatus Zambryskibacteria bacterium RIFOXYD1_FULL_40_13]HBD24851.1 hypothetical protein [Candidatus Zambryskibacteria bacterium]HBO17724.1 hypothetical protein [Candidatus Zambryskibacteria bacterium]
MIINLFLTKTFSEALVIPANDSLWSSASICQERGALTEPCWKPAGALKRFWLNKIYCKLTIDGFFATLSAII